MQKRSIYNLYNSTYRNRALDSETMRALNIIILSVACGMFLFAISGGAAFTGYASYLGAGEFAFGLITALPILAGILQILVSYLIQRTGQYKRLFLAGGIVQRLSWLVVAFIPYIIPNPGHHVMMLIILVTLAAMGGSFVNVTFLSLMVSVVPLDIRGRYITIRQRVCTIVSLGVGLGAAALLDHIPGYLGYTIVFTIGAIGGLIDILLYTKCTFPAKAASGTEVTFKQSITHCFTSAKTRNFLIFWIVWSFTTNLAAPFYTKYAIDILGLSFTNIIIFGQITCNVLTLLIVTRWGVFIDRYGSVPMMMVSGFVSVTGAIVWMFASPGSILPLFIFNFLGGLFWCANDASNVNMQFTHTPENGRPAALAIYAVVTSISSALAFIIGGGVLEILHPVMDNLNRTFLGTPFDHYKVLFACTLVLRMVAILVFLPRVENDKGMAISLSLKTALGDMRVRVGEVAGDVRTGILRKIVHRRINKNDRRK